MVGFRQSASSLQEIEEFKLRAMPIRKVGKGKKKADQGPPVRKERGSWILAPATAAASVTATATATTTTTASAPATATAAAAATVA